MHRLGKFTDLHTVRYFEVCFNPIALRRAKIAYNFGLSECNRVKLFRQKWHINLCIRLWRRGRQSIMVLFLFGPWIISVLPFIRSFRPRSDFRVGHFTLILDLPSCKCFNLVLHLERPKLHTILAFLNAIGLNII